MKKLASVLLVLLLFLAACGTSTDKTVKTGFIGGKEGLSSTLTISSSASTANEVFDNNAETFQIQLNLKNKGETTIKAGDVVTQLDGIDLGAFQIREPSGVSRSLDQLDKSRIEAGKVLSPSETNIMYSANYKYDEPVNKPQDLGINFCYKYETIATADACLRKDITSPVTESKCKVDESKIAGNSGAPVQVTLLTERPSDKNQVSFTIQIENLGKGKVYDSEFLSKNKCSEDSESLNKMHVKISFPDGNPIIKCNRFSDTNEGTLDLFQNKAILTCTADTSGVQEGSFTKSLKVNVQYVYKDSISTKLVIRSTATA